MPALPAVPVPPTDLSAPYAASLAFTIACAAFLTIAIAYAAWRAVHGDRMGVLFLVGGLMTGMLEPMLDYLGLLWFARDNVLIALETFHRHVPLYVVMGYAFYFGGFSYIAYRAFQAERGMAWFWGFFALDWLADFALQATGAGLGLYQYYGSQPYLIFDVPAWWFTIDALMPVLAGGLVFLMRAHLTGWRSLLVIPLVPAAYAGVNAAAGWPVFSALNTTDSGLITWAAGTVTILLALFYRQLMLEAVERSRRKDGAKPPAA